MENIAKRDADPKMFLKLLWAKSDPFHPLLNHLLDVGIVAQTLAESSALSGVGTKLAVNTGVACAPLIKWIGFLAAVHDIGKCHADFQGKAELAIVDDLRVLGVVRVKNNLLTKAFRHEAFSSEWVRVYLQDSLGWPRKDVLTVAASVHGHHGNFNCLIGSEEEAILTQFWEPLRRLIVDELMDVFETKCLEPLSFTDHSQAGVLLSGIIVLSDWIASNREMYMPPAVTVSVSEYCVKSRALAKKAVSRLGFAEKILWSDKQTFSEIWPMPEFSKLRPLQQICEKLCGEHVPPGMAIIEAPMGEGKTEAALYLATQWMIAHGASGMFVGLPTAATSNQMFQRVADFLGSHSKRDNSVQLIHGMAWLIDHAAPSEPPDLQGETEEDRARALEWFQPRKRSLLSSYGVGTIDQAMMAALHVKHGFLRLLGLAGKILIIDEVHAYDTYMSQILARLLEWCRALYIPVILLSATLPNDRRKQLSKAYGALEQTVSQSTYPLITLVDFAGAVTEHSFQAYNPAKVLYLNLQEFLEQSKQVVELALKLTKSGGCLCIIANTVKSAQAIYQEVKRQSESDEELVNLLFHSRFPAYRRQQIENRVLKLFGKVGAHRPHRAILVATQVVEQSLDLDFDQMISELSPIDLLLQRAGRLHRHHRVSRPSGQVPTLNVLIPMGGSMQFGTTESVYERYVLLQTLRIIGKYKQICLPGDIRDLVEQVYEEVALEDNESLQNDIKQAYQRMLKKRKKEEVLAKRYLIPIPDARRFGLSYSLESYSEEASGALTFFHAKTRLGDYTERVLIITNDELATLLRRPRAPDKALLKELFMTSVELPRWWLNGITAQKGYEQIYLGPQWLSKMKVLHLKGKVWKGVDENGCLVKINDCYEFGVMHRREDR